MILDLQPYNEQNNNNNNNNNGKLDLQPFYGEDYDKKYGTIMSTPEVSAFEKMGTMLKNIAKIPYHALKQGSANVRTGELNFKLMNGSLSDIERAELEELENRTPYNYGAREHSGLFDDSAYVDTNLSNFGERLKNTTLSGLGQSTESYPFTWEIMKNGGVGGAIGGAIGGIAGVGIGFAKGGFANSLKTFKSGALLGAKILGGAGSAKKSFELEAGLAYQELKELKNDDGVPIDSELAKRLAYGVGAINAGLEMTGAIAELSTIPMADKLLKSAKIEAVKNIIKDKALSNKILVAGQKALEKYYSMEGLENVIDKATKENINKLAKVTITEMTTEGLQELSNVVADEWAKQIQGNYSDAIFSDDGVNTNAFKENLARVVQASAMAFLPAFTIGGIGTTATAVNIARAKAKMEGLSPDEVEKIVKNMDIEEQSEIINNNEDMLQELANDQMKDERIVEIQDENFNKMVDAGVNESQAFATAKVIGAMAKTFANVDDAQNWSDNLVFNSEKTLNGGVRLDVDTNGQTVNEALSNSNNEVMLQRDARFAGVELDDNISNTEKETVLNDAINEWQEKDTDSKYFKRWFGDSKVVDENGKPLVVYHGSPNATFDEFRNNSHFTKNKDYAEIYKNQGASSLGYKKTADNPNVYEVYLSIKNPFDTRDKKARDIFLNEYQAYYSPDLTDKGMVDWFEVEDLTEWLKENYPEYDGIFADEGGVGGYGDDVLDRGISYIPFNPEQIKSVDNRGTFDEGNPNIYYQSAKVGDNNVATNYDYIHNQVTGEKIKIELNKDIKVDKIEPQEVSSSLPFEISQKPSDNKKALIKSLNLGNNKALQVKNVNTNEVVNIKDKTIEKSLSNIRISDKHYNDFCAILYNAENLFKTSQKILGYNDTKKISDLKINRYANIAKVNNNEYLLEFVTKDNGEVLLYSIDLLDKRKQYRENASSENSMHHDTVNNSITHIQDIFKSKLIKKYNNDYKQQQKASKVHLQETQSEVVLGNRPKTLDEIHEEVRQRAKGLEYLGYFTQENGKHIIGIMENANPSTIIHELSHSYLEALRNLAMTDENMAVKYEAVKKWLGVYGNQELTEAQHETFARGFEAYVYSGKAPNSKLQEVFTLFKNWLKDIRDYWLNNTDYKMSDEVRKVFDTLFEENNNELDKKQKKIKKYLDTALRIKVSDTISMLDSEKRHRDCAYDIVAMATGHPQNILKKMYKSSNRKWKGVKKQISKLCSECKETIKEKGYKPEWTEFYSDATFYNGDDSILATTALNDILNDNFKYNYTNADFFNEYDAQYNYLLNVCKEKLLDRNEILAAMWQWIDSIAQKDKGFGKIFTDRFEKDYSYIQSFEQASALEKAKMEILELANNVKSMNGIGRLKNINSNMDKIKKAVNNMPYIADDSTTKDKANEIIKSVNKGKVADDVEEYRNAVKNILNKIDFLTPTDKAKMFANIIDAPSKNFLEVKINYVMDFAKTLSETQRRNDLLDEIAKELKSTDNVKQNNKLVGKYDYRTNKLFAALRQYMKLTVEQASDLREERMELFANAESEGLSFEDRVINEFLQVKSDGKNYANMALIKQLYDDICTLKLVGKSAKSEEEVFNKLNRKQNIEETIDIIKNKKEANVLEKFYINTTANWESMLNTFFNKAIKNKYSLIWAETKSSVWIHKEKVSFENEVQKIYGLSKWNFDAQILKNLSEEHEYNVNTYEKVIDEEGKVQWKLNRVIPMKMNRMQMILAYMWAKNEVLYERMINMFGEEQLIDMIDELSEQDKKLGDLMMRTVNKYYPLVNAQYIKKYGVDLPKVSAYFPSVTERESSLSEMDIFRDFTQKSTSPSFTKLRSESTHIEMKFGNPVAMLYHHIDTMGRFINMTESLDTINKVFNNSDLKKYIKLKYGDTALKEFMQQLVNISYKQNATIRTVQMQTVNEMVGGWTSGNIIGKLCTGIKQLFASLNYTTVMPFGEWSTRFLKALSQPKETIKYMYDTISYLQYRFESGSQNEALKEYLENNQIEKWFTDKMDRFVKNKKIRKILKSGTITVPRKIRDVASLFLRLGDMGAIIFGGKPYIDYLIEVKHMSKDEAIREFVVETQRTQQSAEISTLSNWQVASTQNPFSKLFMSYKNAQGQFIRKIVDSIIDFKRGDIDKTQLAKDVFMYGFLQAFLFKIATSLSIVKLVNTGDADDLLDDLLTSIFDNLSFFHAFGDIGVGLINRLITGEMVQFNSPLLSDIPREVLRVAKKDADFKDWLHAVGFAIQVKDGIPVNAVANSMFGVGDLANGDIQKGLLRVIGYTENRANIATGKKKKTSKNSKNGRKTIY